MMKITRSYSILIYTLASLLIAVLAVNSSTFGAEMQKIDLNSATQKELMTLNGVGPKIAANIIAHRDSVGPFNTPQEIMDVKGCGPKTFAKNKDRIVVYRPAMSPKSKK